MAHDVVVIGGGPVGCVAAIAQARRGARVLVLEASPQAAGRLAGEWLHPPAVDILRELGVDVAASYPTGEGFAVFPDDGSEVVLLPYRDDKRGLALEHKDLVERLRELAAATDGVEYLPHARVQAIDGQRVRYQRRGASEREVSAELIVGAAGRSSIAHEALGIELPATTCSRMAGLLLEDCELPHEGRGHVFLGGPGPMLAYRLDPRRIRMCLDVPLSLRVSRDREAVLWEAYRPVLPATLHAPLRRALERGAVAWAANQIRPRVHLGRKGLVLVGDAAGHHHPLTAVGMTLGFQDGAALARARSFAAYARERARDTRVPEMLAIALYEVFAGESDEVVAIRRAVYDMWRAQPAERARTMGYLAGQDTSPLRFGGSFVRAVSIAGRQLCGDAAATGRWQHTLALTGELVHRTRWLLAGALRLGAAEPTVPRVRLDERRDGTELFGEALKASGPKAEIVEHPSAIADAERRARHGAEPLVALERGVRALKRVQRDDGSFEGECIWNSMLAAQHTIAWCLMDRPISAERRRLLLRQFADTQLPSGTWGMHELSEPYLFMTTLVYVAARMLGVASDDPLLARARDFIQAEGVTGIPSWGKFWLALAGLYDWRGVNPVLPEVWMLPRWVPLHPSNYYCHTRLIYLGLACLYGETFAIDEELRASLRLELHPGGYQGVDFAATRHELREAEIFTPPSLPLRLSYDALKAFDLRHSPERRTRLRDELREHLRFEVRSSDATCLSPVNGTLFLLALHRHDPDDADLARALGRYDGWIWEDDLAGTRVSGARSASWDTAFAAQALAAAAPHVDATRMLERADAFLVTQQIREPQQPVESYARYYRIDPRGGYCFAGVWHGWPVSDCTAEALVARIESPVAQASADDMEAAARFILRTQGRDGGFGSYEPQRGAIELEWLNPAEMFGDSMTEHGYVECTASCVAALAAFRHRHPEALRSDIDAAITRAVRNLRRQQRPDGTWNAAWGVHFIYATLFGVRGLRAAGVAPQDPAIRRACRWLKARQRPDGGWGEDHHTCLEGRYVEAAHSQVIQTAWALSALLEAQDPDWDAIERGAHFLAAAQRDDGAWPKQEPAGVFFHTALLHYELYRSYFPVWALGLFETRRLERLGLVGARASERAREPHVVAAPPAE